MGRELVSFLASALVGLTRLEPGYWFLHFRTFPFSSLLIQLEIINLIIINCLPFEMTSQVEELPLTMDITGWNRNKFG